MTAPPRSRRYDAVVVGARCAGASTAMLLARRGLKVLAVEQSAYGSDAPSTLALMRTGVLQLRRWGVLPAIEAAGTPALRTTTFHYGDQAIELPIKPRDGVEALYAPRRTVLDARLVDAARDAGAEVLHGIRMLDLERSGDGRVRGVVLQRAARRVCRVEAGIVIGADGYHSSVARSVRAPAYQLGQHSSGVVYGFWSGLDVGGNHWHYNTGANGGVGTGVIPTNGGLTLVFTSISTRRFDEEIRRDMPGGFRRVLEESSPKLAEAVRRARPVGGLRGFRGLQGHLRRAHGPGWALVGDAGYFKDPITAHGISDALRDAELLSRAVAEGGDRALAEYQATRDALSLDLFRVTDAIATYDWSLPALQEMHMVLSREMNREVEALVELHDRGGPALRRTA